MLLAIQHNGPVYSVTRHHPQRTTRPRIRVEQETSEVTLQTRAETKNGREKIDG